jgi:hypothetical protein
MKRHLEHAWTTATLVATAALAVALAIAAIVFTRATAEGAAVPPSSIAREGLAHYSEQQQVAQARARLAQLHPLWKNLTWSQRFARFAKLSKRLLSYGTLASPNPVAANFQGNLTGVSGPIGGIFVLQRQSNCSLSLLTGTYTLSFTNPALQISNNSANYEQILHQEAGLASTAGAFPNGCKDPVLGIGSRRSAYLGTASGLYMFAASGYDAPTSGNALYYGTVKPGTFSANSFKADTSESGLIEIAVGDLNGDGLTDVVGLSDTGLSGTSPSINVWLAKSDGTLGTPASYALTGTSIEAAVVADVNGDGKADVVAATQGNNGQETIFVMTGNGDGTLNAPQTYTLATPPSNMHIANLIAADLRNSGHLDIVASNGVVLLNNGSGGFSNGAAAFTPTMATSDFGPNLVAADFNGDGKLDLAVNNGAYIAVYLGSGDGTFTAGKRYATPNTVGYMSATDLDGDGHADLYVGLGDGGFFGGDQFEVSEGYALMGNGDGSFQGAPYEPFAYAGTNVAALTSSKALDVVGLNADYSFTSYLNDGTGHFSAGAALSTSPVMISGTSYTLNGINSYALGDVDGDGIADLVYIPSSFYGPNNVPGVFVALGRGDGSFGAPAFIAVAQLSPAANNTSDYSPTLSNIQLADVNGDGRADLIYNYYTQGSSLNYYEGTAVQLSNSGGTFQAPQTLLYYSGSNPTNLTSTVAALADLNHDNKPDLVLVTEGSSMNATIQTYPYTVQVALGNGDGSFGAPANVTTADYLAGEAAAIPAAVAVADMNGDGVPDIVALGADANGSMQLAVALGNGDGTFKAPAKTQYAAEYQRQSLAIADFNGDGKLDVATFGIQDAADSGISFGNGDGSVQTVSTSYGVQPAQSFFLAQTGSFQSASGALAADFNGDGKPDVLDGSTMLLSQAPIGSTAPSPSFALTASSSAATATPGQSATTMLTLTPRNGFSGDVTLTCSGLPSGAACDFSPASVTLNGSAGTSTLSISTTPATAQLVRPAREQPWLPGGMLLAGIYAMALPLKTRLRPGKKRRGRALRAGALALFAVMLVSACGGNDSSTGGAGGGATGGTVAGTYTVVITATSGSISQTLGLALTVS